jgi:enoyl-[acyl-carrier protein] reductase II
MTAAGPEDLVVRLHTPICDLLGITHPIVLGGMASGTAPDLVAAVSNAGGLGILGASGRSPTEIREQTSRIRALTAAPFGLNILLFYGDEATVETVLAQRPAVAAFAWPTADQALAEVFARAHDVGAHVMHMVARLDDAKRAVQAGADSIVAQGSEGGGHVGMMSTMVLVPPGRGGGGAYAGPGRRWYRRWAWTGGRPRPGGVGCPARHSISRHTRSPPPSAL